MISEDIHQSTAPLVPGAEPAVADMMTESQPTSLAVPGLGRVASTLPRLAPLPGPHPLAVPRRIDQHHLDPSTGLFMDASAPPAAGLSADVSPPCPVHGESDRSPRSSLNVPHESDQQASLGVRIHDHSTEYAAQHQTGGSGDEYGLPNLPNLFSPVRSPYMSPGQSSGGDNKVDEFKFFSFIRVGSDPVVIPFERSALPEGLRSWAGFVKAYAAQEGDCIYYDRFIYHWHTCAYHNRSCICQIESSDHALVDDSEHMSLIFEFIS